MLRHVIAPSVRYTKASHDVVRHPRLNSDAKILLLYIQGLPEESACKPLGELARKLGIKGRGYQKAKEQLIAHGYVHERRTPVGGGRWITEQLAANYPLTDTQASGLLDGPQAADPPPSTHVPAVGAPGDRVAGGYEPVEEHCEKTTPHPPSEPAPPGEPSREADAAPAATAEPAAPEAAAEPAPAPAPELAVAEKVLLSLRHSHRELHLGVREAQSLAVEAAQWLLRGVTTADLRRALTAELPDNGVRSAVGFLRYRLVQKLPDDPALTTPPSPPLPEPAGLITCAGPGEDHAFRPLGDETECPACRRTTAHTHHLTSTEPPAGHAPWRERFAQINGTSPA